MPPKNLLMMPFRVAMALQADGWYLRSTLPWLKRAAMPESVTDRPSNALEWLFLFSKAPRYFWDAEAIRQGNTAGTIERWGESHERLRPGNGTPNWVPMKGEQVLGINPAGRAFRNTDPWFLSLDAAIAAGTADLARLEAMRATGGMLCDDDGLPLAVDINPAAYKEAHFATYPPAVVVPFVKAGTSERGCCPRCLAPWTRVVERDAFGSARVDKGSGAVKGDGWRRASKGGPDDLPAWSPPTPLGWQSSCAGCADEPIPCSECDDGQQYHHPEHYRDGWGDYIAGIEPLGVRDCPTCEGGAKRAMAPPAPIPCTVFDPFAGSGTTLLVADRLGRDAVGIELSPEYARMAEARIAGDAPLWVGMAAVVEAATGDYAPLGLFGEAAG